MQRRGFLKSLLGVAALAAHAKFGSLVPIATDVVEDAEINNFLGVGLKVSYSQGFNTSYFRVDNEVLRVTGIKKNPTGRFYTMSVERGIQA